MSLSRIVKKPGNIVINEIVQIKDYPVEPKIILRKLQVDSSTQDLSNQIINDAELEAQRIIDEAMRCTQLMKDEFELECKEIYAKTKRDAYKEGYDEGVHSSKNEILHRVEVLSRNLIALEEDKNLLSMAQFEETIHKVHRLALEIASKIMRQKITVDDAVLKPIIMDELAQRKRQNISLVEVSQKAQKLIQDLEYEFNGLGIRVQEVDKDVDHLIIEGEMGRYDLSIETQIKNIKRLFETI